MKQFFSLVFGGLSAVVVGIGLSYAGITGWQGLSGHLTGAVIAGDGTSISGMKRMIRWNATEEEDSSASPTTLPILGNGPITASAYAVRNLSHMNEAALARDADRLMPIASLTKLVTAEIAHSLIPDDTRITLTQNIIGIYGNTGQFKVGETFTANDLMYPLLMVSSNDAAEAYAQSFGRDKFITAMNDFVQSIGAYRTYFVDPSGLSPQNVSTANDMIIILDWLHRHDPEILSITREKSRTVRTHTFVNPTHFLSWSNYAGGKNGYTPEANRTGASLFTAGPNKSLYAVVVLGSNARDNDEFTLLNLER